MCRYCVPPQFSLFISAATKSYVNSESLITYHRSNFSCDTKLTLTNYVKFTKKYEVKRNYHPSY